MKRNLFEMGAAWEDTWSSNNKAKKNTTTVTTTKPSGQHLLYCSKEKRRGKIVTVVQPFFLEKAPLQSLLKTLKKRLGTGGTIKENTLELQGDIADAVQTELIKEGFAFKKKRT